MLTFGLNRPLYSFGLSYPGYFFVIVEDETRGRYIFKVVEPNSFKAFELVKLFEAYFGNSFIAVATEEEKLGRYFFVFSENTTYSVNEVVNYFAKETGNKFDVDANIGIYYLPLEVKTYLANDKKLFKASQASIYGGEL